MTPHRTPNNMAADGTDLESLLQQAEQFVEQELQSFDASHDVWHIKRVRATVQELAAEEGLDTASRQVVELAALLHDVQDWKYAPGGSESANQQCVEAFLQQHGARPDLICRVLGIISTVGFKDELGQGPNSAPLPLENAILQDADRLDAIGAVGIARCLTYGGRFNRVLHDPAVPPRTALTKAAYMQHPGACAGPSAAGAAAPPTTLNHFYEKLLKLKGLMKTAAGRRRAEQRHAHMEAFLAQFLAEWEGKA